MNKAVRFLSDWAWQLPQNLIGIAYRSCINNSIISQVNVDNTEYKCYIKRSKGGVTLGKYIFVSQNYSNIEKVILHESGHVKQSKILGPLYLLVIGLPSIIHAAVHKNLCNSANYYHFYTEKWANKLAGLRADKIGRLYRLG